MSRTLFALVFLLLPSVPAVAQSSGATGGGIAECTAYTRGIDAVVAGTDPAAVENLLDISRSPRCFALFAAGLDDADRSAFRAFVKRLEGLRADKQTGASAGSSGGTSIVAQGPAARVLSVAAEYGALTQSVNGQVVTIRGNLAGVPSALVNQNVFPYCVGDEATRGFCVDGSALGILKRFSFSVSFDPSRTQTLTTTAGTTTPASAPQPVTFTASGHEIAAFSARAELWNRRDASTPEFAAEWRKKVGAAMNDASGRLLGAATFAEDVMNLPDHDAWFKASVASVRAAGPDRQKVVQALTAALQEIVTKARVGAPDFQAHVDEALAAYSRFFLAQDDLIDTLATRKVLAFEYTSTRPVAQPSLSNYRVILDYPFSPRTKLVANGAFTFYDSVPSGQAIVTRYRDAQIGAQLDHGLRDAAILGPAVLSLAAYYQYQHSPALLDVDPARAIAGVTFVELPTDAKKVFATAGDIFLVQGKLSLVPPGSAIKVPISITWSNRTELIDEPVWRGQIGVSYDLDSLFAGLGGLVRTP
jgi:hypothetical protein